jgi:signal transduction histidine kinase
MSAADWVELTSHSIRDESDVFSARRRARTAAAELGLEDSDQVRVATAVSEVGRVVVGAELVATIAYGLRQGATLELVIEVSAHYAGDGGAAIAAALEPARRLMDSFDLHVSAGLALRMAKSAGPASGMPDDAGIGRLRAAIARSLAPSALDDLRAQNAELMSTLEQLTAQQQELVRLNDELAETNRGVMAMYSQLSEELEETNRGVVALYADLDERGAQLRDASTAKSRFLASVSHELRSPLNSVLGLAALLQQPDSDPLSAEQRTQISLIGGSAQEVLDLVNDLLDIAKAEAGALEPQAEALELSSMFADLRATTRPLARPSVEVVTSVAPDVPEVRSDPVLLARLLRNLLSNAAKFTESGVIRLAAVAGAAPPDGIPDGVVRITVSDTGIGIDQADQQLVFDEFYQVPGPLQVGVRSSGLGLPYARKVAIALGGSLRVDSVPGAGSVFTLDLPALPPSSAAAEQARLDRPTATVAA